MRASIRQVAERAQVSRMTVTRVLQGRKNEVNEETYNRVMAVVHDLEYVPVRPVMQNRQIKTDVLGMVPYYRNPSRSLVDTKTFEGLCDQASRSGYDLFVMLRGEAEWMANREELRFLDRRTDGFIFISPGEGEWKSALEALVRHEIPVVVCFRRDVPEGVVWVDPDNNGIIDLAVDCLARQGHSQIGYFSGPSSDASDDDILSNLSGARINSDNKQRMQYFRERMAAMGHANPDELMVYISSPDWKVKVEDVQRMLDKGITGAICGDIFALQVCDILEEMGKKVPDDLSIISVDDQMGAAAQRGLTAIGFGYDAVGRAAVLAWIERQENRPAAECCKVIPVNLVERNSVGPVPHRG